MKSVADYTANFDKIDNLLYFHLIILFLGILGLFNSMTN